MGNGPILMRQALDNRVVPIAVAVMLGALLPSSCVNSRCYENKDCSESKICGPEGICLFECSSDRECGSSFKCVGHRCKGRSKVPVHCPEDMAPVDNAFCIDRYEASRPDATWTDPGSDSSRAVSAAEVIPWQVAENAIAKEACVAAGKRLCTPTEWRLACEGPDRTAYSYGNNYDPSACNGIDAFDEDDFHLSPTGQFERCTNQWGLFDMNGNLWEHVAGGTRMTVRGGAYNCSDSETYHRCNYIPGNWEPAALGFRCCLEATAEK
jgi:hypothetical protein